MTAGHVIPESQAPKSNECEQLSLFEDYDVKKQQQEDERVALEREKCVQRAIIAIKKRFGKNAVVKGMNFEDGATAIERNGQIGGHKA